jgi:hypothetical protein
MADIEKRCLEYYKKLEHLNEYGNDDFMTYREADFLGKVFITGMVVVGGICAYGIYETAKEILETFR